MLDGFQGRLSPYTIENQNRENKHLCSDTCTHAYFLGLSASNSLLLWLVDKADKINNNEDNGYLTSYYRVKIFPKRIITNFTEIVST